MAEKALISRFTPSRTPADVLEQILVQRQDLIADSMERISESALKGGTHHLLFVGPRGIGKTHLVSLINHRVQQSSKLDKLRLAWLNEDETATTFLELLLRTHRALSTRYPIEFPDDELDAIYDLTTAEAENRIKQTILQGLGKHKLLILVENLDRLFSDLGLEGQQHFRAFLQENPIFIIVGTSQQLVEGIADRKSPFFGFFQIEHLQPLSLEESRTLLKQIATYHEDRELVEFLETDEGLSRLEAIYHLSGGNHRVYIVLSEFISREQLDELVNAFEKMLDELTPYYQEKLRSLSAQQRKLVEFLCRCERPTPVKVIARQLFITQQTASSQLKELRDRGYVVSNPSGRESLYELSEPLLKLCVEVKENNREPIRLIVRFLREWYTDSQLESTLSRTDCSEWAIEYIQAAMTLKQASQMSRADLEATFKIFNENLVAAFSEITSANLGENIDLKNILPQSVDDRQRESLLRESVELLRPILEMNNIPGEIYSMFLLFRSYVYVALHEIESAKEDWTKILSIEDASHDARFFSLFSIAMQRDECGDYAKALEYCKRATEVTSEDKERGSIAMLYYSVLSAKSNRWDEAWDYLATFLSTAKENPEMSAELIKVIAHSTPDRTTLKKRVSKFVSIYREQDKHDWLASALTRSIKRDLALTPSSTLRVWKSVWEESIADLKELRIARRIFATGIDFLISNDPQVLNELVLEERKILIDALDLEKSK